jgi:hypothetical protein
MRKTTEIFSRKKKKKRDSFRGVRTWERSIEGRTWKVPDEKNSGEIPDEDERFQARKTKRRFQMKRVGGEEEK